jgi:hypothetical protein
VQPKFGDCRPVCCYVRLSRRAAVWAFDRVDTIGIEKLKADGLVDMHPSGTRIRFTDMGAQRFRVSWSHEDIIEAIKVDTLGIRCRSHRSCSGRVNGNG